MTIDVSVCSKKHEREESVAQAKRAAQKLEKQLLLSPKNKTAVIAMRAVCYMLLQLAQRYIPKSPKTYCDYEQLLHCIRLLQELGFNPPIAPETAADSTACAEDAVTNSRAYRYLRNQAIACLATIADLTEKPTAAGPPEYQRGMREGYRRASDIAVVFLTDFDAGDIDTNG